MKSLFETALTGLMFLMAATAVADAQPPAFIPRMGVNQFQRPTTNPYLDLLSGNRRGRSLSLQYFRVVRPEQEFRRYNGRFGQDLRSLKQQVEQQRRAPFTRTNVAPTGHTSRFMAHGGFYRFGFPANRR